MQAEGTENKTALTPNVAGDGNVLNPSDQSLTRVAVFNDVTIHGDTVFVASNHFLQMLAVLNDHGRTVALPHFQAN